MKKPFISKKELIWLLTGVVCGILAIWAVFIIQMNNSSKLYNAENVTPEDSIEDDNSEIHTVYDIEHTVLKSEDAKEISQKLYDKLHELRMSNIYMQIATSDTDGEIYIYNENGECFAEKSDDTYTAIYRNDGYVAKFDYINEVFAYGQDIDILSVVENATGLLPTNDKSIDWLETDLSDTLINDGAEHCYCEVISGGDAFYKLYRTMPRDFTEQLLAQMRESTQNELFEPTIVLEYITYNDDYLMINCYNIVDGQQYIDWSTIGYLPIGSWSLQPEWYNNFSESDIDFNNLKNELTSIVQGAMSENETLSNIMTDEEINNTDDTVDSVSETE